MKTLDYASQLYTHYDNELGVEIEEGLYRSTKKIIREIEFASNSEYLSGKTDALGRYKPYYNIINFRVDVAISATDIDVKDFEIKADHPKDADKTKVLRKEFYEWAKKERFGQVLNDFNRKRVKYGGAILKKVEKNGKLTLETLDWRNIVINQTDVLNGALIERHFLSPVELSKKIGVWGNVKEAIKDAEINTEPVSRMEENQTNEAKIEVWEMHAELPLSYFKEAKGEDWTEDDEFKYTNQVYFLYVKNEKPQAIFYCSEEKEMPYKYLAYVPREGFGLGEGVVEQGLEAQRVINNYVIAQYNAMELAGKTAIITDSDTLANNALTDFETGDFIKINQGEQVSSLNLAPSAFTAFTGLIEQWDEQFKRRTSTFDAVTGEEAPSGTPFRSIAMQNQSGKASFNYRVEEAGLFWEDVVNEWIMPNIIKKLNRKHILSSEFTGDELEQIDNNIVTKKANQKAIDAVLNGKIMDAETYNQYVESYKEQLRTLGKQRFLDIPEDYYKDFEGYATVMITNEKKNKGAILESLSNILLQVAQAPQILQDKKLKHIFSQIVEMSGADISPIDLNQIAQTPMQLPQGTVQQEQPVV
jgi:hypothetical protein